MFWNTWSAQRATGYKDLSERVREDMENMGRYWDITEGFRCIIGNKERVLTMLKKFRVTLDHSVV
jgi:hypothetical protein